MIIASGRVRLKGFGVLLLAFCSIMSFVFSRWVYFSVIKQRVVDFFFRSCNRKGIPREASIPQTWISLLALQRGIWHGLGLGA
jgi:hypothetical protein